MNWRGTHSSASTPSSVSSARRAATPGYMPAPNSIRNGFREVPSVGRYSVRVVVRSGENREPSLAETLRQPTGPCEQVHDGQGCPAAADPRPRVPLTAERSCHSNRKYRRFAQRAGRNLKVRPARWPVSVPPQTVHEAEDLLSLDFSRLVREIENVCGHHQLGLGGVQCLDLRH